MKPTSCLLVCALAFVLGCGHLVRPEPPVCEAPRHAPTDWTSPQNFSSGWERPVSTPTINCAAVNTKFVVEQWRDFNPEDGEQRALLGRLARGYGFETQHYNAARTTDLMIIQAFLDGIHDSRQILTGQERIDENYHRLTWLPEPNWWRLYGVKLQVFVRVRDIEWSQLCSTDWIERRPDLTRFHDGLGRRELVKMRIAAECEGGETEIRYDTTGPSTPGQFDWRVFLSSDLQRYAWREDTPIVLMLVQHGLIHPHRSPY